MLLCEARGQNAELAEESRESLVPLPHLLPLVGFRLSPLPRLLVARQQTAHGGAWVQKLHSK